MKYEEVKQYLKQNPYCFRTLKEREEEFNYRIMEREGRRINFATVTRKFNDENIKT